MATQQFINVPRPFPSITTPPEVTSPVKPLRIVVGIVFRKRSVSEHGWALAAAGVRMYRNLPLEVRAIVNAAVIAAGVLMVLGIVFVVRAL